MKFNDILSKYIKDFNCTTKELATASELSSTVISRYQSGKRIPQKNSEQFNKLVNGIHIISIKRGKPITEKEIILSFDKEKKIIDFEQFTKNFSELVNILEISLAEMARNLNYDSSYLSRVKSGKRKPTDIETFIIDICNFCCNKYSNNKPAIANLIGCKPSEIDNRKDYFDKLFNWLSNSKIKKQNYIDHFLKKLDEFELNEYIHSIHFDELKIPTAPFKLPTSKNYYGIDEMKKGELDFLKSTALSKLKESVFMCSDMPMEDLAKDIEFGKKWMFGIAAMLKKGLHLNIIHNLDRPFNEMMLGLESWIPIYMTGQVSPYYLKEIQNGVYCHLNYVSGSIALSGECIKGKHNDGKYYLTNNKEEIKYYKKKSDSLIDKSYPLIEIYREDSQNYYSAFLTSNTEKAGNRHNIYSSLPIYTMKKDLLLLMLNKYKLNDIEKENILNYYKSEKERMSKILYHSKVMDEIVLIKKEEYEKYPITISLSGMFCNKKIYYTYDEYINHFNTTKEYEKENKNYSLKINNEHIFKNIQISIHEKEWAMVSKNTNPTIHFIIKQPKLRNSIENFIAPIIE